MGPKRTFSVPVRHGNHAYSWKTIPRSAPAPVTIRPSTRIVPVEGGRKPAIILRRVDFPQPDGPSKHVKVPAGHTRSTVSSASFPSNAFLTPRMTILSSTILTHPEHCGATARVGPQAF